MKRQLAISVVAIVAVCAVAASAAVAAQETLIYGGEVKSAPAAITLGSWGSGSLQEVSDLQFEGINSMKLTSQGDFQGGRIWFKNPLDISTYAGQPNAYIEMWVRPYYARPKPAAATSTTAGATQPGTQPGTTPGGTLRPATPATRARAGGLRLGGTRTNRLGRSGVSTAPGARVGQPTAPMSPYAGTRGVYGSQRLGGVSGRTSGIGASRYGGLYGQSGVRQRTLGGTYGRTGGLSGRSNVYGTRGSISNRRTTTTSRVYSRQTQTTQKPQTAAKPEVPAQTGPAPANEAAFRTEAFRVELSTDRGTAVLPDSPIYPGDRNAAGWVKIGFPLRDFKGTVGDKLNQIAIFTERPDTVYIGQVKLLLNVAPLEARPVAYPAIAKPGQPVTLMARATEGLAPIRAVWDFDKSNGMQEEAVGTRVTNVYNKPGDYEATVTVSDATGANPETKSYVVLVRVK